MKTLSFIFVLAVLLISSWGILQAAAPARIAYCELDCLCNDTWRNVQCYCWIPYGQGPHTCGQWCDGLVCE